MELIEQPRLADAGLTNDPDHLSPSPLHLGQDVSQGRELALPAYEPAQGALAHTLQWRRLGTEPRNPITAQTHYVFTGVDHPGPYVLDFDNARGAL